MDTVAELKKYGIGSANIRKFAGSTTPELLDYLDLVEPSKKTLLPDGVAENQGRALLFFIDESHLALSASDEQTKFRTLRRSLACRGERAYLARILPGELKVVPVGLDDQMPEWKKYHAGTGGAETFFSKLILGQYDGVGEPSTTDQVFKEMFELLDQGAERLASQIGRTDVLSLIGRVLFFRFLQDRGVINEKDVRSIAPKSTNLKDCFENAQNASSTCAWLDRTFNGDFLHLSENGSQAFFESIARKSKDKVFSVLSSIVRGDKPVGTNDYQGRLDWGHFDFAHIPIGLLSQIYEKFIWKWDHQEAKDTSVHYTPRNIASMLVDEAFDKFASAHKAKILDPACGAGVFLVLAFRRLYREHWKAIGQRPNTRAIRIILEKQLTGFDISDSALKLSALSLYLTAIELDPKPIPPEKLKFKNLRDKVLFNPRDKKNEGDGITIGSLTSHLDRRFNSKFDLILSNPPWTSLPKKENQLAKTLTKVSQDVIRRRSDRFLAEKYINPDSAPDMPFLWKSTEWCKPNGRIAMALPARILFKQEDVPRLARSTLFQLIEITGIINGSNLSDTNVWPEMQQPFMLLFARNRRPKLEHTIRFITPLYDSLLNQRGEVRIDSKSAQLVELEAAARYPWLWKTLAVGTTLDVGIVQKLDDRKMNSLKEYWEGQLKLVASDGYKIAASQPQHKASFLKGLPDLNDTNLFHFKVDPAVLNKFNRTEIARPRKREIYCAPLVLVKESPGINREGGLALLSNVDVAFNQSFYGYSAAGHPYGELLVRYIHLLVHSLLWIHYALLTSAKLGAERRTVYKSVLDSFPVVSIDTFSDKQKENLLALSKRLENSDSGVFPDIDVFVANLYGLDDLDLEVIRDTLNVCLPYTEFRQRACQSPTNKEREVFCKRLKSLLSPFFEVIGKQLEIELSLTDAPFGVIKVYTRGHVGLTDNSSHTDILTLANETGATRIIQETDEGLVIGIFNQYRYWTFSRARLLAADILREHTAPFEVK